MTNLSTEITNWRFFLTPLDRVRFGVEQDPDRTDYFVRSTIWPQQTALLGLLRYELLRHNNLLLSPGKSFRQQAGEIDGLIGVSSFDGEKIGFGIINEIGPLSVCKFDSHKNDSSNEEVLSVSDVNSGRLKADKLFFPSIDLSQGVSKLSAYSTIKASYGGPVEGALIFESFNPKVSRPTKLVLTAIDGNDSLTLYSDWDRSSQTDSELQQYSSKRGVFVKFRTAGVTKDYTGKLQDSERQEHYYVSESYKMCHGFGYSFSAKLFSHYQAEGHNDKVISIPDWSLGSTVRFGSDGYPWMLWAEKASPLLDPPEGKGSIFLLLTDARVSIEILDWSKAIVGGVEHFRNQRKNTSHNFYQHNTHSVINDAGSGSTLLNSNTLLKRGTVVWAKDEYCDDVCSMLKEKFRAWYAIGYNRFCRFETLDPITPIKTVAS